MRKILILLTLLYAGTAAAADVDSWDADKLEEFSYFALKDKDYKKATKYMEAYLAKETNSDFMVYLGGLYKLGKNGPVNRKKALSYFNQAAQLGNSSGMLEAGILCAQDNNYDEAVLYYYKAIQLGNVAALWRAGLHQVLGDGITKNVPRGVGKITLAIVMDKDDEISDGVKKMCRTAFANFSESQRDSMKDEMDSLVQYYKK